MTDRDPDRLATASDDPLLRDLLGAGRGELPDEKQIASVLAKLGPILGGGGGGGGGGAHAGHGAEAAQLAHATTGVAWLGGAKLAGAVVVLAAAAWGVNYARIKPPAPRPPAAARHVTASVAASVPDSDESSVAPVAPDLPLLPSPIPSVSAAAPTPSASSSAAPRPVLPPAEDSEAEIKLLERAQDALFANPAAAVLLADEDVRRFPDGLLRQEAEVIAIDALVRTGRRAPAEARAKRFRAAYPTSTHLRRIDELLAPRPAP